MPYRRHDGDIDGVVITFTDITAAKVVGDAPGAREVDR
jgi:hypothetical protein